MRGERRFGNSQPQPPLSLILAVTYTTQTDDQRVNKRWVKSRDRTRVDSRAESGISGERRQHLLMTVPTGVEGEGAGTTFQARDRQTLLL